MERTTFRSKLMKSAPTDGRTLARIRRAIDEYLRERGVADFCRVTVTPKADGFEIAGTVDSQWARAVVFSLMRPLDDKGRILDRLEVLDVSYDRNYTIREAAAG